MAEPKEGLTLAYIIHPRIEFECDPDTGIVSVMVVAGVPHNQIPGQFWLKLMLTQETSRLLLAELPKLEAVLQQASKGPTKPGFVQ